MSFFNLILGKLTACFDIRNMAIGVSLRIGLMVAASIVCADWRKSPVKGLSPSRGDQSTRLRGDSAHIRLAMMDGRIG